MKNDQMIRALRSTAEAASTQRQRIFWWADLFSWILSRDIMGVSHPEKKLLYLLDALDANPDFKKRLQELVGNSIRSVKAVSLFSDTELSRQNSFLGEALRRVQKKFLPRTFKEAELLHLFEAVFTTPSQAEWLTHLSEPVVKRVINSFLSDDSTIWSQVKRDVAESLIILSLQVSSLGFSPEIRERRLTHGVIADPFYELSENCVMLGKRFLNDQPINAEHSISCIESIIDCERQLEQVGNHLEDFGVSVDLVYRMERIKKMLLRMGDLLSLLDEENASRQRHFLFFSRLALGIARDFSLQELFHVNLRQLSRKIVERSGETGEHYITRTPKEYLYMFSSAAGGGIFTAFTALFKFLIAQMHLAPFFDLFASFVNYSGSFIAMHLCGFTLATKQPSMTAACLAGKIKASETGFSKEAIDEIANITRSQFIAAVGNVGLVIPTTVSIFMVSKFVFGTEVLTADKSRAILSSLDPTSGGTIFYAAVTGVILWISSVAAGWLENWTVYNRISSGIAGSRGLRNIFGNAIPKRAAIFVRRNISALGGSVALGFLLAVTPYVGKFFGIGFDVRHVTLSAGSLAFAVCHLGKEAMQSQEFVLASVGIVVIGLLNFGVSFFLALSVALRARDIQLGKSVRLYSALFKSFLATPARFLFPRKG